MTGKQNYFHMSKRKKTTPPNENNDICTSSMLHIDQIVIKRRVEVDNNEQTEPSTLYCDALDLVNNFVINGISLRSPYELGCPAGNER